KPSVSSAVEDHLNRRRHRSYAGRHSKSFRQIHLFQHRFESRLLAQLVKLWGNGISIGGFRATQHMLFEPIQNFSFITKPNVSKRNGISLNIGLSRFLS